MSNSPTEMFSTSSSKLLSDRPPVFLIGAARSGTKFLRDVLAVHPEVAAIPFDVNFIWRLGNEGVPHDELTPAHLNDALKQRLNQRLRKASGAKSHQVLLEKTVSNGLRIPFIREVFPDAKFVHLLRDGRSVIESVHRVWDLPTSWAYKIRKLPYFPLTNISYAKYLLSNALPGKSTARIWGIRYSGIEKDLEDEGRLAVCAHQWDCCVERAMESLEDVPAENQITVRYEDLVQDETAIQGIASFMGLSDPAPLLNHYRSVVQTNLNSKWETVFTEAEKTMLQSIIGGTLGKLGYGAIA